MPTDREPLDASKFHGDVVAFAVVGATQRVDWQDGNVPAETLWIPEAVVQALIAAAPASSLLRTLNIYLQNRLQPTAAERLLRELEASTARGDDIQTARSAIVEVLRAHLNSPGTQLLIEGP